MLLQLAGAFDGFACGGPHSAAIEAWNLADDPNLIVEYRNLRPLNAEIADRPQNT